MAGEADEVLRRARGEALRKLPRIDELAARVVGAGVPRWAAVKGARAVVEARRQAILAGGSAAEDVADEEVVAAAKEAMRPSLRPVINATGVVLHTNFGRAPLAEEAVDEVVRVATGYSNLEYDVAAGERGSRHAHVAGIAAELCGAEDAVVVNNGAAAVMLGIAGLAVDREVVVSRGELVEIGGGFRIPDVMRQSGARLVEVGTTNKTHRGDYEAAVGPATGLLLKVHRSNFAVVGFTEEVSVRELVAVGRAKGVPVMVDVGSGTLVDLAALSGGVLTHEPTVPELVAAGADLVAFSGDKLLGGPQAGVLVGKKAAIARVAKHPLMRVLRPDKMTVAALAATLALYRGGPEEAAAAVPALAALVAPAEQLRERAEAMRAALGEVKGLRVDVVATKSAVGGGALPLSEPASWALAVTAEGPGRGADALDAALRAGDPPVIGRISDGKLLLDVRTVGEGAEEYVVTSALRGLASAT